jgi:hypothetical protein
MIDCCQHAKLSACRPNFGDQIGGIWAENELQFLA